MVEPTATSMEQIRAELQEKYFGIIDNKDKLVLHTDEENLKLYLHWDEQTMSIVVDVPLLQDLCPDDFRYFLDEWHIYVRKVNKVIVDAQEFEPIEGIPISMTEAQCPPPLCNRVSFYARFNFPNFTPSSHLNFASERGSEPRINWTEEHDAKYVRARCHIAGWHIKQAEGKGTDQLGT